LFEDGAFWKEPEATADKKDQVESGKSRASVSDESYAPLLLARANDTEKSKDLLEDGGAFWKEPEATADKKDQLESGTARASVSESGTSRASVSEGIRRSQSGGSRRSGRKSVLQAMHEKLGRASVSAADVSAAAEEGLDAIDDIDAGDMNLTRSDYLHIVFAFILPGALAMTPVMMPFGTPFARDGDNGILPNWAYYFWYTPIGWGAMWLKIVLWNSELWDREFFFPFMHSRPGFFRCNGTLAVVLINTLVATCFYLGGYCIFHNPVPIGTISFGVPCFVVLFILMYVFVVPPESRATLRDHFRILRCWMPFVLWVIALCIYMALVWVQTFVVAGIENKALYVAGNIGTQALFITIRELFAMAPLEWFMGDQHLDLSMLWNLGYSAMCSTMSDWIFPGMPTDTAGLLSTAGVMLMNFVLSFVQFLRAKEITDICEAFLNNICDVISGWAFLFLFSYNAFGPNHGVIYIIAGMDQEAKLAALGMIGLNFLVNAAKLLAMFQMARHRYDSDPELKKSLVVFGLLAMRRWYWLIVWLLASTCVACGACMVMMQDGMDFSFTFKEWQGTWPFVSAK
jgi:hypothetical protein